MTRYPNDRLLIEELFRYLAKAEHLTLDEEIKTCAEVAVANPALGNLWDEFIRQVRSGVSH